VKALAGGVAIVFTWVVKAVFAVVVFVSNNVNGAIKWSSGVFAVFVAIEGLNAAFEKLVNK
jgi:hypothetical protein